MSARMLKQIIIELTRGGCNVETLAHDPPAITFRSPTGTRCALRTDRDTFQLVQRPFGGTENHLAPDGSRFSTLADALRAACRA